MLETGLGQVSEQSEGTLSHLRHGVLHALIEQVHDVGVDNQLLDVAVQTFRKSRQQVQRNDHEVLVGGFKLVRTLTVGLEKGKSF